MSVYDLIDETQTRFGERFGEIDWRRVGLYVVVSALAILYLLPLEVAIVTSLKSRIAVAQTLPYLPPGLEEFTYTKWIDAFEMLQQGLINSTILVIPVTVISATMGSLAAYGLTLTDWRGRLTVMLFIIAAVFFPTQAAIVPLSKFWSIYVPLDELLSPLWQVPVLEDHHGDLIALIVTNIAFGLPICTVLFRAHYKSINDEIIEAARMDGASTFAVYRRIVLPLSGPPFAVTAVYQFIQNWNSFLFPLIIMFSKNHPAAPVTLHLAGIGQGLEGVDFGLRMGAALLTAAPALVVFLLFGEQFARGVSGGT